MMSSTSSSPPRSSASCQVVGLVAPHQRRLDDEILFHAEVQRDLHRLQRVVAAIGIAGIIRLAHAADEMAQTAAEGDRGGEREEQQIAAGHEGVGQAVLVGDDGDVARHRRLRDRAEHAEIEQMILAEPARPGGIARRVASRILRAASSSTRWRWR